MYKFRYTVFLTYGDFLGSIQPKNIHLAVMSNNIY